MTTLAALQSLVVQGESETIELKRSTAELKRVGSTTTVMSQDEYARLLLDRNHSRHRWENQTAVGVHIEDLDCWVLSLPYRVRHVCAYLGLRLEF